MKKVLAAFAAAVVLVQPLRAQERITRYNSLVEIHVDGSIDVTENISVHAEGYQIRRGIYRDFPTLYRDRFGNGIRVGFDVLSVQRNGVTEPWFTQRKPNGIRINTGNDNFLAVPADYTYTLKYHTTRQLGFFPDHDELYWNAIGTGWIFPIESGMVEVRLPAPVPVAQMHAEAYTGVQGAKGNSYEAEITAPGVAEYRLTRPLGPYEGLTIVLTFPKGLIIPPTSADEARSFISDYRGVLVGLVGFLLTLLYMLRTWQRVGRDPKKGIIIARYEPSEGQTPAGVRFMRKMGYDMKCFTADVLALAIAGRLKIHQEKHMFGEQWSLEMLHGGVTSPVASSQETLLAGLFPGVEDTLILKNTNATTMMAARGGHQAALLREYQPEYFNRNGGKVGKAALIAIAFGVLAFAVSRGIGLPAIVALGVLLFFSLIIFARLVRAPTAKGRALLDEIEGFKLYMSVAEKQELASMRAPDEPVLNAERYEALLPYAVALEVEEAWTKKFTAAVGAAAAAEAANNMGWYHGSAPISNLGSFSNAIGSSLSSSISSASTAPGSSSGFGGGGSSGGGGGGGGGGGR